MPAGEGEEAPLPPRDPLSAYAVNLTERARLGQLDPLFGRHPEIQRALEVLCRRRKNNPVFVGEAGVGKTALVEGLAQCLLADDVPEFGIWGSDRWSTDVWRLMAAECWLRAQVDADYVETFRNREDLPRPVWTIDAKPDPTTLQTA